MAEQVITLAEAANISNDLLVEGVIEDIITVDEWYQYLPFVMFEGLSYSFTREKRLAKSAFAAPGTNLNDPKYQRGATFMPVAVHLSAIIGEIIMDGQIEDQLSDHNDQLQVQISSKAKDIARTYMNAIINLRRVPGGPLTQTTHGLLGIESKFSGMKEILDGEAGNLDDVNHPFYNNGASTQTSALVEDDPASPRNGRPGRVYSLEDLDALVDRITTGKPDFLMMHSRDIRTLRTLLRNTGGGTDANQIQQAGLGNMKPRLMYQEVPVFRNDFVSRFEPVNLIDSGITGVVGATSITTAEDYSVAVPAALLAGIAAGKAEVHIRDNDGILRRWLITAASMANPSVLTVAVAGSFMDTENNEPETVLAPNDALLSLPGESYKIYERNDGSEVYAGRWGQYVGLCGFTSANDAGVVFEYVGPRESENAHQYRLKWYCGFDLYNRLSLARMKDVLPLGA